jgi:hypothetical protein
MNEMVPTFVAKKPLGDWTDYRSRGYWNDQTQLSTILIRDHHNPDTEREVGARMATTGSSGFTENRLQSRRNLLSIGNTHPASKCEASGT